MEWNNPLVSSRNIILKGAPWKLGDYFFYFPASFFLISWRSGESFSFHYDESTSEMNVDSYMSFDQFKDNMIIFDMKDPNRALEGLKELYSRSYNEGRQDLKSEFRRLIA